MDKKQTVIKTLKIAGTVIYAIVTAFLIAAMACIAPDIIGEKDFGEALGGAIMLIITVIASAAYIIPVVLGGIGAFMSSKIQDKKSKIYFVFMIFVPIATAIINFVTYLILLNT